MLSNNIDKVFDAYFSLFPTMIISFIAIAFIGKIIGPLIGDIIGEKKRIREEKQKQLSEAEELKNQIVREMTLRNEFDDWLAKEILRLKIVLLRYPERKELTEMLVLVEATKLDNTAKMLCLQKEKVKKNPHVYEEIEKVWGELQEKSSIMG
ncbi:hypothetical protein C9426_24135 [Serratia sp. S1B]|nr:hypothetical protein C9426_24135 [Serratia sp. S1B]